MTDRIIRLELTVKLEKDEITSNHNIEGYGTQNDRMKLLLSAMTTLTELYKESEVLMIEKEKELKR